MVERILQGWTGWGIALITLAIMAVGCSDDVFSEEGEFLESRDMYPYEFDGQPEIEGPESLRFLGLDVGEYQTRQAEISNSGRASLDVEGVTVDGPFQLVDSDIFEGEEKRLRPGEKMMIEVGFTALDSEPRSGILNVQSNDSQRPVLQIELEAIVDLPCPEAVIVGASEQQESVADPTGSLQGLPLETVTFDARQSQATPGRELVEFQWSLIERPADTQVELGHGSDRMANDLYLELSGRYVVELEVWDDLGQRSCEPARMEVNAVSADAIHLQLVWDTPNDPSRFNNSGSDMDLHFLHQDGQWNRSPYDCHWLNPNPDWGEPEDTDMNPRLDIDEVNGWGPENINLLKPEEGVRYGVGVNYFSDHGYGPSYATVRIFIHGQLVIEMSDQYMEDGQFWHVADIDWPSREISLPDEVSNGFPLE